MFGARKSKMASEEQKRLLTQKLFRSIKSKQRSSTCPITKDIVPEKNISNEISESTTSKEHEQELTKLVKLLSYLLCCIRNRIHLFCLDVPLPKYVVILKKQRNEPKKWVQVHIE